MVLDVQVREGVEVGVGWRGGGGWACEGWERVGGVGGVHGGEVTLRVTSLH